MAKADYGYRDDADVPNFDDNKPIIVFDGHCVLCSRWAQIVMRYDTDKSFKLLAAQTDLGEALYAHYGLKSGNYNTNLLIENGRLRIKSDGSITMCERLGWPWKIFTVLRIFPAFLRDPIYDLVAKNRLKWFGKREVCFVPPPGSEDRFF